MKKKSIVLSADNGYLRQLTTTIKSVCAHNKNIKFYIFNQDIPGEWFKSIRKQLERLNCEIEDVKIFNEKVKSYKTTVHLNYAAYFRYFIPEYVKEKEVLYLDSDIVVTKDLSSLFEIDLEDNYVAAVYDHDINSADDEFNSGVLLINMSLWRRDNIVETLIEVTDRFHSMVNAGDQSIMNIVFKNRWKKLHRYYNYMVGFDNILHLEGREDIMYEDIGDVVPDIIHYATSDKPWNTFSATRLRELWWYYHDLDWVELREKKVAKHTSFSDRISQSEKNIFIMTNSWNIEKLKELVESLPEYHFNIAATVFFSPELAMFAKYDNVTLYANIMRKNIDKLMSRASVYLDISHESEPENILSRAKNEQIPIFTFNELKHSEDDSIYDFICSKDEVEKMILEIKAKF